MTNHVKIYGVKPRIQYVADGTLTAYEFPFAIFETSDINVYFSNVLQDASAYTVSEPQCSDGGSVTFNSAPPAGTVITIVRNLSIERTSDFQEGGALRADTLNDELDYQIACQQQLADNLNRSMVLPPYAADIDVNLTLPTPAAGKAIVWNEAGTNLENSTVSVNALESTLNSYKTAAETAAEAATNKASVATTQADIATTKAEEATTAANQLSGIKTNCITEIPQNIMLDLDSNGTLTLKASSKYYMPDGTMIQTVTDITGTESTSQTGFVFVGGSSLHFMPTNLCFSGANAPSGEQNMLWLDTANNVLKYTTDSGTTWSGNLSLPLGIITVSDGQIKSIDRIFNGFGYIGSSLFILPDISFLRMNGRNADGTPKSSPTKKIGLKIYTNTNNATGIRHIISYNPIDIGVSSIRFSSTPVYATVTFDLENNLSYSSLTKTPIADLGTVTFTNGIITAFNPKTVFNSTDYNDFLQLKEEANSRINSKIGIASSGSQFVRFEDGTLIQWGGLNSGQTTVTFASPFADTNYSLTVNAYYNSASQVAYYNRSTTGCTIYPNRNDYGITYIAIGKWK